MGYNRNTDEGPRKKTEYAINGTSWMAWKIIY